MSALLARMQRYAMEHLHDPELGPEQIAQAHFVSTRYVHKLFAASGSGVSAWIRERRFERAVGELRRSPGNDDRLGRGAVGIPRSGQLQSRLPRATYGCAPRELRQPAGSLAAEPRPLIGGAPPTDAPQACGKPACRRRVPQIPDLPGAMIPFGSSVSLIVSLKRRCAWSLKPNWSAARSMNDRWARYSP